jgi:hypothetical protein
VFPHKIRTVLTDNGIASADLPKNHDGPSRRFPSPHIFDRACMANGIERRLTNPWSNGQAERKDRTIKDATVKTPPRRPGQPDGSCPDLRHRPMFGRAPQGPALATLPSHLRRPDQRTHRSSRSTRTSSRRDQTPGLPLRAP